MNVRSSQLLSSRHRRTMAAGDPSAVVGFILPPLWGTFNRIARLDVRVFVRVVPGNLAGTEAKWTTDAPH